MSPKVNPINRSHFTKSLDVYQADGLEAYLRQFDGAESIRFAEEMERIKLLQLSVSDFRQRLNSDEWCDIQDMINTVAARIVEAIRANVSDR